MIFGFNNQVVCEPYASRELETSSVGSGDRTFKTFVSKEKLVPLKVLFGVFELKDPINAGDLVYVMQDRSVAFKTIEIEGYPSKVVLVPLSQVQLVKQSRDHYNPPAPPADSPDWYCAPPSP